MPVEEVRFDDICKEVGSSIIANETGVAAFAIRSYNWQKSDQVRGQYSGHDHGAKDGSATREVVVAEVGENGNVCTEQDEMIAIVCVFDEI